MRNAPPFAEHPLREALLQELHTRPPDPIEAPAQIYHLAMLTGEDSDANLRHLGQLCSRLAGPAPAEGTSHFVGTLGNVRVKFERHTEFVTYTFIRRARLDRPFMHPVIDLLPEDWLATIPGQAIAAVQLALEPGDSEEVDLEELSLRHFAGNGLLGAGVGGGAARAYSDLRLHDDHAMRILVRDDGLKAAHAGRTVQRLLEINTYRAMALLALPVAQDASPVLRAIDRNVADLAARMADPEDPETDGDLLKRLSSLSAELESLVAANDFRFAASRAYHALVEKRLRDLREVRLDGIQTFTGFLERRLAPAMATCESVARRQESLSVRVARVASLLRARVEVELHAQNTALLESMNRRVKLQIRLQEAVEGLSVVAISYYLIGLVGYLAKGAKAGGLPVSDTLVTGLAVPVVALAVWYVIKRAKQAVGLHEEP